MRMRSTIQHHAMTLVLVAALGLVAAAVPAYATPVLPVIPASTDLSGPSTVQAQTAQTTVQTKQAAVADLQSKLDALYLQMEQATEDWDAAQQALANTQLQLTASKSDLAQAQSALDVQTRQLMENELLELWSADRKSVVFITHDLEEAISLSDRVVVLSAGPDTHPIGEYKIDLERPRDVAEIRLTPRFIELHTQIWHTMKAEVLKGYVQQQR